MDLVTKKKKPYPKYDLNKGNTNRHCKMVREKLR